MAKFYYQHCMEQGHASLGDSQLWSSCESTGSCWRDLQVGNIEASLLALSIRNLVPTIELLLHIGSKEPIETTIDPMPSHVLENKNPLWGKGSKLFILDIGNTHRYHLYPRYYQILWWMPKACEMLLVGHKH